MAAGIRPNADLARAAGLAVDRGVVIDDRMATDDPDVFAVGECVEHRGVCYGLVAPLYEMARVLAARLAGDATARYGGMRSEEHTSELQSPMRISYAVFCLKKQKTQPAQHIAHTLQPIST